MPKVILFLILQVGKMLKSLLMPCLKTSARVYLGWEGPVDVVEDEVAVVVVAAGWDPKLADPLS